MPHTPLDAIATAQGLFYLVTGGWPIIHVRSFQAVMGSKTDVWLVNTVGLLLVLICASLMT